LIKKWKTVISQVAFKKYLEKNRIIEKDDSEPPLINFQKPKRSERDRK